MFGLKQEFLDGLKDSEMKISLQHFVNFINEKTYDHNGKVVHYTLSGDGPKTLVILPGTTGRVLPYFEFIMSLSKDYRIIAINYLEGQNLCETAEITKTILSYEGCSGYYVLGHSLGGIVAQELIRIDPENCGGLILAHSYGKTQDLSKKITEGHLLTNRKMVRSSRSFKYTFFRNGFAKRIESGINRAEISNKAFWSSFFKEIFIETSVAEIQTIYGLMVEFWESKVYDPKGFERFKGKVLIIESEIDKSRKSPEKEALKELFPDSETFELSGSTNLSIVKNKEQFIEKIALFIRNH